MHQLSICLRAISTSFRYQLIAAATYLHFVTVQCFSFQNFSNSSSVTRHRPPRRTPAQVSGFRFPPFSPLSFSPCSAKHTSPGRHQPPRLHRLPVSAFRSPVFSFILPPHPSADARLTPTLVTPSWPRRKQVRAGAAKREGGSGLQFRLFSVSVFP